MAGICASAPYLLRPIHLRERQRLSEFAGLVGALQRRMRVAQSLLREEEPVAELYLLTSGTVNIDSAGALPPTSASPACAAHAMR